MFKRKLRSNVCMSTNLLNFLEKSACEFYEFFSCQADQPDRPFINAT